MSINTLSTNEIAIHNKQVSDKLDKSATGNTRQTDITSRSKAIAITKKLDDLKIARINAGNDVDDLYSYMESF